LLFIIIDIKRRDFRPALRPTPLIPFHGGEFSKDAVRNSEGEIGIQCAIRNLECGEIKFGMREKQHIRRGFLPNEACFRAILKKMIGSLKNMGDAAAEKIARIRGFLPNEACFRAILKK
jgi:hypothetical protein